MSDADAAAGIYAPFNGDAVRALAAEWKALGETVAGGVIQMDLAADGTQWVGAAGNEFRNAWPQVRDSALLNNQWCMQIATALYNYADEAEAFEAQVKKAETAFILTLIFGFVLDAVLLPAMGAVFAALDLLIGSLVEVLGIVGDLAIGAITFTARTVVSTAVQLGNDILSQLAADRITHVPFVIDWAGEGFNLGMAALGGGLTAFADGVADLPVPPKLAKALGGGVDLPKSSPHIDPAPNTAHSTSAPGGGAVRIPEFGGNTLHFAVDDVGGTRNMPDAVGDVNLGKSDALTLHGGKADGNFGHDPSFVGAPSNSTPAHGGAIDVVHTREGGDVVAQPHTQGGGTLRDPHRDVTTGVTSDPVAVGGTRAGNDSHTPLGLPERQDPVVTANAAAGHTDRAYAGSVAKGEQVPGESMPGEPVPGRRAGDDTAVPGVVHPADAHQGEPVRSAASWPTKDQQWEGYRQARDADFTDRLNADAFVADHASAVNAHLERGYDVFHAGQKQRQELRDQLMPDGKGRSEGLFASDAHPSDAHGVEVVRQLRDQVGDEYRTGLAQDLVQHMRDGRANDWHESFDQPPHQQVAKVEDLFVRAEVRADQGSVFDRRFAKDVEDFKQGDPLGAHVHDRDSDYRPTYKVDDKTGIVRPEEPDTAFAKFRFEQRDQVMQAVDKAMAETAGRPHWMRELRVSDEVSRVEASHAGALQKFAMRERQVDLSGKQFDEAAGVAKQPLQDKALAKTRDEFLDDVRDAFDATHSRTGHLTDAGAARAWHIRETKLVEGLPERLDHARFLDKQIQRGHAAVATEADRAALHDALMGGDDRLVSVGDLGPDALDRVHTGLDKQIREAVDAHWQELHPGSDFRGRSDSVSSSDPARDAGAVLSWDAHWNGVSDSVPTRLAHERDLVETVHNAAGDFNRLTGPEGNKFRVAAPDKRIAALGDDFRGETVKAYDRIFTGGRHDSAAWLKHEAAHENDFGASFDRLQHQEPDTYRVEQLKDLFGLRDGRDPQTGTGQGAAPAHSDRGVDAAHDTSQQPHNAGDRSSAGATPHQDRSDAGVAGNAGRDGVHGQARTHEPGTDEPGRPQQIHVQEQLKAPEPVRAQAKAHEDPVRGDQADRLRRRDEADQAEQARQLADTQRNVEQLHGSVGQLRQQLEYAQAHAMQLESHGASFQDVTIAADRADTIGRTLRDQEAALRGQLRTLDSLNGVRAGSVPHQVLEPNRDLADVARHGFPEGWKDRIHAPLDAQAQEQLLELKQLPDEELHRTLVQSQQLLRQHSPMLVAGHPQTDAQLTPHDPLRDLRTAGWLSVAHALHHGGETSAASLAQEIAERNALVAQTLAQDFAPHWDALRQSPAADEALAQARATMRDELGLDVNLDTDKAFRGLSDLQRIAARLAHFHTGGGPVEGGGALAHTLLPFDRAKLTEDLDARVRESLTPDQQHKELADFQEDQAMRERWAASAQLETKVHQERIDRLYSDYQDVRARQLLLKSESPHRTGAVDDVSARSAEGAGTVEQLRVRVLAHRQHDRQLQEAGRDVARLELLIRAEQKSLDHAWHRLDFAQDGLEESRRLQNAATVRPPQVIDFAAAAVAAAQYMEQWDELRRSEAAAELLGRAEELLYEELEVRARADIAQDFSGLDAAQRLVARLAYALAEGTDLSEAALVDSVLPFERSRIEAAREHLFAAEAALHESLSTEPLERQPVQGLSEKEQKLAEAHARLWRLHEEQRADLRLSGSSTRTFDDAESIETDAADVEALRERLLTRQHRAEELTRTAEVIERLERSIALERRFAAMTHRGAVAEDDAYAAFPRDVHGRFTENHDSETRLKLYELMLHAPGDSVQAKDLLRKAETLAAGVQLPDVAAPHTAVGREMNEAYRLVRPAFVVALAHTLAFGDDQQLREQVQEVAAEWGALGRSLADRFDAEWQQFAAAEGAQEALKKATRLARRWGVPVYRPELHADFDTLTPPEQMVARMAFQLHLNRDTDDVARVFDAQLPFDPQHGQDWSATVTEHRPGPDERFLRRTLDETRVRLSEERAKEWQLASTQEDFQQKPAEAAGRAQELEWEIGDHESRLSELRNHSEVQRLVADADSLDTQTRRGLYTTLLHTPAEELAVLVRRANRILDDEAVLPQLKVAGPPAQVRWQADFRAQRGAAVAAVLTALRQGEEAAREVARALDEQVGELGRSLLVDRRFEPAWQEFQAAEGAAATLDEAEALVAATVGSALRPELGTEFQKLFHPQRLVARVAVHLHAGADREQAATLIATLLPFEVEQLADLQASYVEGARQRDEQAKDTASSQLRLDRLLRQLEQGKDAGTVRREEPDARLSDAAVRTVGGDQAPTARRSELNPVEDLFAEVNRQLDAMPGGERVSREEFTQIHQRLVDEGWTQGRINTRQLAGDIAVVASGGSPVRVRAGSSHTLVVESGGVPGGAAATVHAGARSEGRPVDAAFLTQWLRESSRPGIRPAAQLKQVDEAVRVLVEGRRTHTDDPVRYAGDLRAVLSAIADWQQARADHSAWLAQVESLAERVRYELRVLERRAAEGAPVTRADDSQHVTVTPASADSAAGDVTRREAVGGDAEHTQSTAIAEPRRRVTFAPDPVREPSGGTGDLGHLIDDDLDRRRPTRVLHDIVPPSREQGPVEFTDGARLPAYFNGVAAVHPKGAESGLEGGSYGHSRVTLRSVDKVVRELGWRLSGLAPFERGPGGLLSRVEHALRTEPDAFTGKEGREFSYQDVHGHPQWLRIATRHYGKWERFLDSTGAVGRYPSAHRVYRTTGGSETTESSVQLSAGTGFGPAGPLSGFGRVSARIGRAVGTTFTLVSQLMSGSETRAQGSSHTYTDDIYFKVTPMAGDDPTDGFAFGVRNGLMLRIMQGTTEPQEPGRAPREIELGPESNLRLPRTEGFGPVDAIREWATGKAGAEPGSSAFATVAGFFSSRNMTRNAAAVSQGSLPGPPLFAEDGTPLGSFVVEGAVPERAFLVDETKEKEMRAFVEATEHDERAYFKALSAGISGSLGPSFTLPGFFGHAAGLRLQAALSLDYGFGSQRTVHLGGNGTVKTLGQAGGFVTGKQPTDLYLVQKAVHVRWTGDENAKEFRTWSLDRLTRDEARRLAGWDDGSSLPVRSGAEPAPAPYLTKDHPRTLGMSRVEEFTFEDGSKTHSVNGRSRTALQEFSDQVLAAVADRYPGMVARVEHLRPPKASRQAESHGPEQPKWRDLDQYRMALDNTQTILTALSHASVAQNLQTMTTVGMPVTLKEQGRFRTHHRQVWLSAELTDRQYKGTTAHGERWIRNYLGGAQQMGQESSTSRAFQGALDLYLSVRDAALSAITKSPNNTGTAQFGARLTRRTGRSTATGATLYNEPMGSPRGPAHLHSYKLSLTAHAGGYGRIRGVLRFLSLGALGSRPLISREPQAELVGGEAGKPFTARVLLAVPAAHSPDHASQTAGAVAAREWMTPASNTRGTIRTESMSTSEARALADGTVDALVQPGEHERLQLEPVQTVAVLSDAVLPEAAERIMGRASGGAQSLTQHGFPAHDSMLRSFHPTYWAAHFDQNSAPLGSHVSGLHGRGPYQDNHAAMVVRTRLENPVVLGDAVQIYNEQTIAADVELSASRSNTSQISFGGVGTFGHFDDLGRTVTGSYSGLFRHITAQSFSRAVSRTVNQASTMNWDNYHQFLIGADVRVDMAAKAKWTAAFGLLGSHLLGGNAPVGQRLVLPAGYLGHVPEPSAYRLGLVQDGLPAAPEFKERAWVLPPWLRDNIFGSHPINALDTSELQTEILPQLRRLGFDEADLALVRTALTPRATRALLTEMSGVGVTVTARGSVMHQWGVTIGGRELSVRLELIPGEQRLEQLQHAMDLEDYRNVTQTTAMSRARSRRLDVGFGTSQAVSIEQDNVGSDGPILNTSGYSSQQLAETNVETRTTFAFVFGYRGHAEYAIDYRMKLTVEAAGTERLAHADRKVGSLRQVLPLSLASPVITGVHKLLQAPRPPLPEARQLVWPIPRMTDEEVTRWRRGGSPDSDSEPPVLTDLTFQVRWIAGLANIHDAGVLAIGGAYSSRRRASGELSGRQLEGALREARGTALTRRGTMAAQALTNGVGGAALAGFYRDTLAPEGYEVPGLATEDFIGGANADYRLFSRPDFKTATLLTVDPKALLWSIDQVGHQTRTGLTTTSGDETVLSTSPVILNDALGAAVPSLGDLPLAEMSASEARTNAYLEIERRGMWPEQSRLMLFWIPTRWLSIAGVHHLVSDSALGKRVRGTFGDITTAPVAAETDAPVVAWVDEHKARELGLINDENFPAELGRTWDEAAKATEGWIAAAHAYWDARRPVRHLQAERDAAQAAYDELLLAAAAAEAAAEAEAETDTQPAQLAEAAERLRRARDAYDTAAAAVADHWQAADDAVAELHRVRAAADQLTRWYQLPPARQAEVDRPEDVTYQAPEQQSAPERPTYTVEPADGKVLARLVAPTDKTYLLHDVPPRDSFLNALAEGMRHNDPYEVDALLIGGRGTRSELLDALRDRLVDGISRPENADLAEFIAADEADRFTPEELAQAEIDLGEDTPARREFDALGVMPQVQDLSAEQRAALAEAQLRRADGAGLDSAAADLLPALAARELRLNIAVVQADGSFQEFQPRVGAEHVPTVVLYLADRHFQVALAEGSEPRTGLAALPESAPPHKAVAETPGQRPAHTVAPWWSGGEEGRYDTRDHERLTAPDGSVYELQPATGAGNGFFGALSRTLDDTSRARLEHAQQPDDYGTPWLQRAAELDPAAGFHRRDLEAAGVRLTDELWAVHHRNGGRLPEGVKLSDQQRRSLVTSHMLGADGWSATTTERTALQFARWLKIELTLVAENGTVEFSTDGRTPGSDSRSVVLYRRGRDWVAAVPTLAVVAHAHPPLESSAGSVRPGIVSQQPVAGPTMSVPRVAERQDTARPQPTVAEPRPAEPQVRASQDRVTTTPPSVVASAAYFGVAPRPEPAAPVVDDVLPGHPVGSRDEYRQMLAGYGESRASEEYGAALQPSGRTQAAFEAVDVEATRTDGQGASHGREWTGAQDRLDDAQARMAGVTDRLEALGVDLPSTEVDDADLLLHPSPLGGALGGFRQPDLTDAGTQSAEQPVEQAVLPPAANTLARDGQEAMSFLRDWRNAPGVSKGTSILFRAIGRAVTSAVQEQADPRLLRDVLRATEAWRATKAGKPSERSPVVRQLEENVRLAIGSSLGVDAEAIPDGVFAHAGQFLKMLSGPVAVRPMLLLLRRHTSVPDAYTAGAFEDALTILDGRTMPDIVDEAVAGGRLQADLGQDVKRALGPGAADEASTAQRWQVTMSPTLDPARDQEAAIVAAHLNSALGAGDLAGLLDRLNKLDRDGHSLIAVGWAWENRFGSDMLKALTEGPWAPADGERLSVALGFTDGSRVPVEVAEQWYRRLHALTFRYAGHGDVLVDPGHPEEGCFLRAHMWATELKRWGATPRKAMVARVEPRLTLMSEFTLGARSGRSLPVSFEYHIAPVVDVVDRHGVAQQVVLDPTVGRGVLTMDQWLESLGVGRNEARIHVEGSIEDVHEALKKDQRKHPGQWDRSSGRPYKATVVVTDGYAYDFPVPTEPVLSTWQDAEMTVRGRAGRLFRYAVRAERRATARALWETLDENQESPSRELAARLADVVVRRQEAPELLTAPAHQPLVAALKEALDPGDYESFGQLFPSATASTVLDTDEDEESLREALSSNVVYAHPHHAPSNRRAFTQRSTMPNPLPDSAEDWVRHLLEVPPPERVRALVAMGQDMRDDVFVDQDLNGLIMESLSVDEYAHLTDASQDVPVVQGLIDVPAARRARDLADVPLPQRVRILNTQPLVDLLASRLPAGEFDAVLTLLGVTDRHYATVAPDGAQVVMDRLLGESPAGRAQLLDNLKPENRRWLAVQPDFVDALREDLSLTEFVDVAARLLVHVDTRARHPAQTRAEARRRLGRLLQDRAGLTADRLLKAGVQLLVIPTDVAMTDLPPFRSYRGRRAQATGTGAGRQRDEQRGLQWGSFIAVGEENFLGLETPIGHELHAPDGYSIAEHEIAHAVHEFALTAEERGLVQDVYAQKMALGDTAVWPDGKRLKVNGQWVDNYSAKNVFEFFSQISVTYLGTNFGTDPDTRQSRNNGPQWVEQNEPRLLPLLRRLYGPDPSRTYTKTNPVNELRAEEGVFAGFRQFMRDNDGTPARASRSWAETLAAMDPAERAAEVRDMMVEDRAALRQDTGFADRLRELLPTHESSAFLRDLQGTVLTDRLLQGPATVADLTADERALVRAPSNIERLEEGLPEDRYRTVKSYLTADNLVVKTPTERAFLARSLNPLERAELLADPVLLGLLQQRVPEDEYRRFLEALDVQEEADTASESESDEWSLSDAPALRTTLNAPAALDLQSPHRFGRAPAVQQELDDSLAESDAASVRSGDTDAIRVPSPFLLQGWDRATDHVGLVAFADEVHRRLDADDPRGALRVVERLERDLRRLWALEDVWEDRFGGEARFGEGLHQRLRTELAGDESLVDRVFGEPVRESVSVDEVHVFYERLEELEFLHPVEGSLRLPHDHPESGCHLRAHEIALKLQQWGVRPHKVTVSGPGLGTMSENALHAFPGQPRHVQWDWHIATAVYTEDQHGNPGELTVLDPALARGPLSRDEWLRASGADPAQVRILHGDVEQIRAAIDTEATSRPDLWMTAEETIYPLGQQVLLVTDAGMLDFNGSSSFGPTLRGVDDLLRLGEHANLMLEHRREADDRRAYRALMEVVRAPASARLDGEGRAERLRAVLDPGRVTGSLFDVYEDLPVHIHDFVTAGGGERSLLAAEALRSEINDPELGRDSFFPVLDATDYATLRPDTGQSELAGPDAARSAALVVLAENAFEGSVDPQALAEATTVLWAFVGALLEVDDNEGHLDELVRETLRMTTLIDELTARPVVETVPEGTDSPVEVSDLSEAVTEFGAGLNLGLRTGEGDIVYRGVSSSLDAWNTYEQANRRDAAELLGAAVGLAANAGLTDIEDGLKQAFGHLPESWTSVRGTQARAQLLLEQITGRTAPLGGAAPGTALTQDALGSAGSESEFPGMSHSGAIAESAAAVHTAAPERTLAAGTDVRALTPEQTPPDAAGADGSAESVAALPVREYSLAEALGIADPSPYESADHLAADLVSSAKVLDVRLIPDPGPMGVDLFGILAPLDVPEFLRDPETGQPYDYSNLTVDESVYLLHLMDMRQVPVAEYMNPATWEIAPGDYSIGHTRDSLSWAPDPDAEPLESLEVRIPALVQAIWFGGALRPEGPSAGFWKRFGEAATTFGENAVFVLWSDVPRRLVDAVRGLESAPQDQVLGDVWRMVRWAEDANIRLVNPFEVFNASRPLDLHDEIMTDLAKQTGPGKAAASDGFRLEAMDAFGGKYSDGDNSIRSLEALITTAATEAAFSVHADGVIFNNSAYVMPPRHPFVRGLKAQIKENYQKAQADLYGPAAARLPKEFYSTPVGKPRRNSVMLRTGPDSVIPVARRFGFSHARNLPRLTGIGMGSDNAWLRGDQRPPRVWSAPETLEFTSRVVHTMVRSLYNRNGDLHLTQLQVAVEQHPQPDLVWEAAFGFLSSREDLRGLLKGVTAYRWTRENEREVRVELPQSVRTMLRPLEDARPPIGDEEGWWLGERSVAMRLLGPRELDRPIGGERSPIDATALRTPGPVDVPLETHDTPAEPLHTDALSITRSGERTDVGDWQPPAQWRLPVQPLNSQRQFLFEELLTVHMPAEEARELFVDLGNADSTVAESAGRSLRELGGLFADDIAQHINEAGLLIAHTELRLELTDPLNAGVLAMLTQNVANSLNHRMLIVLAPGAAAVEVCPSRQMPAS